MATNLYTERRAADVTEGDLIVGPALAIRDRVSTVTHADRRIRFDLENEAGVRSGFIVRHPREILWIAEDR